MKLPPPLAADERLHRRVRTRGGTIKVHRRAQRVRICGVLFPDGSIPSAPMRKGCPGASDQSLLQIVTAGVLLVDTTDLCSRLPHSWSRRILQVHGLNKAI